MLPILIVAVVARTAYLVSDPSGRRELDGTLVIMLGTSFLLAFLANLKFVAVIMIMAYAVTIVVRKRSVSLKLVLLGGVGLAVAAVVIFPLINLMRSANQVPVRRTVDERADDRRNGSSRCRSSSSRRIFGPTWKAMRMARGRTVPIILISETPGATERCSNAWAWFNMSTSSSRELIATASSAFGPPDGRFSMRFRRVLNGEKTQDSMCDIMFAHAGILPKGFKNDLTLGMVGGSYAMFGWYGVATIPFILFTCFFLQQRVWAGNSTANLWAIVLLIDSFNPFTETEPSLFIEHLIREFPLHFLALYFTHLLACVALRIFPGKHGLRIDVTESRARFQSQPQSSS